MYPLMQPNKKSVFLEEQENEDPQQIVPDEQIYHLHDQKDTAANPKAGMATNRHNKNQDFLQTKKTLIDTRENMIQQMGYILKEKDLCEDRIINGMALLKSNIGLFNNMLEYSVYVKKQFFDLYFKVKSHVREKDAMPVSNNELRLFRTIDDMKQKVLATEIEDIGEKVLFTETLHKIKKPELPEKKKS